VGLVRALPWEPGLNPPTIHRTKHPAKSMYIVFDACDSSTFALTSAAYRLKKFRTSTIVALDGSAPLSSAGGTAAAFFKRLFTLSGDIRSVHLSGFEQRRSFL